MPKESEKTFLEVNLGRSTISSLCGIAVIILAGFGLAHYSPFMLVSIAAIVLGAAFLFKGLVISGEYSKLLSHLSGTASDNTELSRGMSSEIMAGTAAIVLGIFALLSANPNALVAIAAIFFGGGLILDSGIISKFNSLKMEFRRGVPHHKLLREIMTTVRGTQILAGIAVIILAILSLVGVYPLTLNLIAMIVIGASLFVSDSFIAGRMARCLHYA